MCYTIYVKSSFEFDAAVGAIEFIFVSWCCVKSSFEFDTAVGAIGFIFVSWSSGGASGPW